MARAGSLSILDAGDERFTSRIVTVRKTPQYYVPKTAFWKWEELSPQFVKQQRLQVLKSLADMDADIDRLGAEIIATGHEIRSKWASASVQVMTAFEDRLLLTSVERRRLVKSREKLAGILVLMDNHLREHRWS